MPEPIIQNVSGQQYIADTTVNNPQALTNSDAAQTEALLTAGKVSDPIVYSDDSGSRDQPATVSAG